MSDLSGWLSASLSYVAKRGIPPADSWPATRTMLSQSERRRAAVNAAPAIRCPNCGMIVQELGGGEQRYTITVRETGGKSHRASLPTLTLPELQGLDMTQYSVEPCGCRVDTAWAGRFTVELNRRLDDLPPQPVSPLTGDEQAVRLTRLQAALSALYAFRGHCHTTDRREAVEFWIVAVADQMQRSCPGVNNRATGRLSEPVQDATPMPSSFAAVDVPIIRQTKARQWGVRFGDTYRVFVTEQEAHFYAQSLASAATGVVRRAPQPLRTTPVGGFDDEDDGVPVTGVGPAKPPLTAPVVQAPVPTPPPPPPAERRRRKIRPIHNDLDD